MCGIVGFVDPERRVQDADNVLARMQQALTHRGPDQEGAIHSGAAHLGHRRLAIVDPSESGRQPFQFDDVFAVANGEIYNHDSLRQAYLQDVSTSIARSDCAVLPGLWKRRGPQFIKDLVGMFALAIWDNGQETLLLGRDPAGQKPLYYAQVAGGGLAFASELKALLEHPQVSRNLNPMAIRQYLAFDYVPGSLSVYGDIKKLRPGAVLRWHAGQIEEERYFLPSGGQPQYTTMQEGADAVWSALQQSVSDRLMSDVPLGVFLSGGVDSAAVVAAMSEIIGGQNIRTFSIGFDDPGFDESGAALQIANSFGTQHHVKKLSSESIAKALPDIMATLDEPFADASYVPTYLLSQFAAQEVKVVLSGDGGDELFLGYPTFYAERQVPKARLMPRIAREKVLLPLISAFSKSNVYMPAEFKWRRFLRGLELDARRRHVSWIGGIDARDHQALLRGDFALGNRDIFGLLDDESELYTGLNPVADELDILAHQYFRTYLAEGVLQKVDRASMAHSLEVRSPFLAPQIMAVAARCSVNLKLRGKESKRVLRQALEGRIASDILSRPKRGFALPMARWLREDLRQWMLDLLDPTEIDQAGIFDPKTVSHWVQEHLGGKVSRHKELWTLLSFETWRRGPHGPLT